MPISGDDGGTMMCTCSLHAAIKVKTAALPITSVLELTPEAGTLEMFHYITEREKKSVTLTKQDLSVCTEAASGALL